MFHEGFHFPSFSRPPNTSLSLSHLLSFFLSLTLHTAALALHTNLLVVAQNLVVNSRFDAADVEAVLAAFADDYLAFNLRPAASITSARGATCMVDIVGASVIICTNEFRRAP